jgi:uncharacterized repeat protein (TIGR04138 family)
MSSAITLDDRIHSLASRDELYTPAAYHFVFRALDFVLESRARERGEPLPVDSHVAATELLDGLRSYALELYGPLARMVLESWGLNRTEDFGEIVFRLVDCQLLNKQESDRKSDFADGFNFRDAFDEVLPTVFGWSG